MQKKLDINKKLQKEMHLLNEESGHVIGGSTVLVESGINVYFIQVISKQMDLECSVKQILMLEKLIC